MRCVVKKDEAGKKVVVEERKRKRSASSSGQHAQAAAAKAKADSSGADGSAAASASNHNSDTETAFEDDDLASAAALPAGGVSGAPGTPSDLFLRRDLAKKFRSEYESFRRRKCDEFQEYLRIDSSGVNGFGSADALFDRAMANVMGAAAAADGDAIGVEVKEAPAIWGDFVPAACAAGFCDE